MCLAVEKAGSGGADVYKPDDYQEPDKIAVYQPPKKDEDEYKAPKKDDEVVYNPPAKVEVYVVDEQKDDTYKPPKKDDYAVIDDTYKAIGDVFLPIRFATNSDHLDHAGFKEAERLADFLIKQKVPSIIIEGHTDDVGKASYNLDLSERRARTLANFLKSLGVHTHIRIIGKGEHEPPHLTNAAIYSLDEQRTIARRVEVSFGY